MSGSGLYVTHHKAGTADINSYFEKYVKSKTFRFMNYNYYTVLWWI
jgi:hypothetical protein